MTCWTAARGASVITETELPLRILERDGAPVVRCLCGAELAGAQGRQLQQEISSAGLIRMIMHVKRCDKIQGMLI